MHLQSKINWFGLAGGIATILLIAVSIFVPWWQLTVGDSLIAANVSPIFTNFNLVGNSFTVPLLFAINLSCILLSLTAGIVMLVYSLRPMKPYAKTLLGFSYKTPLLFVIVFVIGLIVLAFVIQSLFSFNVPLLGTTRVNLPSDTTQGMNVSILLSAGFVWPFYLAIASAALCIAARLYHKRISSSITDATASLGTAKPPTTSAPS
jgi:hypothetical protein